MEESDARKIKLEILLNSTEVRCFGEKGEIVIPKTLRKRLEPDNVNVYSFLLVDIKEPDEYRGVKGVLIYPIEISPKRT